MFNIKVLMFGWEFAPIVAGGLGVVCRSITENLCDQGVLVTYVLPKIPAEITIDKLKIINASKTTINPENLKLIKIKSILNPYLSNKDYLKLKKDLKTNIDTSNDKEIYGANLFQEVLMFSLKASIIAKENDFDIIHAHDWMTLGAGIKAKQLSNKPFVAHIHATEIERTAGNPDPVIFNLEKKGLEFADRIFAVSERTKRIIVEHYKIDPQKITVVHNSVDSSQPLENLNINQNAKKNFQQVLFLARLAPSKGADYLLKAAQKVIQINPNVKFVLVGKGSELDYLVDLSKKLKISNNVTFTGFLQHDQVDLAYKQADLFVLPSIAEPFGITVLEAIRNGTPVLISKQSGASEVIENALKVDFWDIDEMATKILAVLKHKALADELIVNGKSDLDNLTWSKQTKIIINSYQEVINQHAK